MTDGSIKIVANLTLDEEQIRKEGERVAGVFSNALSNQRILRSLISGNVDSYNSLLKQKAIEKGKDPDKVGLSDEAVAGLKLLQGIQSSMKALANSLTGLVKMGLGYVEDIYKQMKRASPLLETIESLFSLAITLFFMPLGNKLGELLIPAVMEMMEAVMEIWDKFDEAGSLGEMMEMAVKYGVELLAGFFNNIGEILSEETGIIGTIGKLFVTLSDFLENHGENLINLVTGLLEFMIGHLDWIIGSIITLLIASVSIQMGILAALVAANPLGAVGLVTAGIAFGTGLEVTRMVSNVHDLGIPGFASGGYIPATPGGQLIVAGEGGEGEYIIPESRIRSGLGMNATYNFYGLSNSELQSTIRSTVNDMISESKYKGGF